MAEDLALTSLVDPTPGTCPVCLFDAMVQVQMFWLHSQGVSHIATSVLCARCAEEEGRAPDGEAYP